MTGLVACLFVVALMGSGSALAKSGVVCEKTGKRKVSCPKKELRGKHGKRGAQGPAGPAGAAGAGSGLTLNFNAKLGNPFGTSKTLSVGANFIIRASATGSGVCDQVELLTAGGASLVSVGGGPFLAMGPVAKATLLAEDKSTTFTAVTATGFSTVSGIIGRVNSGGFCLVSGYVTGA